MIYESNTRMKKLDKKLFENPTSEYRAAPFWAWNCDLDRDELLRQIDVFKEMGFGGYHMHVRTGMSTVYLSDEFMALIKACVEHGKEQNMLSWLYDEDRWASGAAGGYVTRNPEYRQKYMVITFDRDEEIPKDRGGHLLAAFDLNLNEEGRLVSYKKIGEKDDAEGIYIKAYARQTEPTPWFNNQGYADLLSKEAVKKFIEITYEAYARTVGKDFGTAIPAIFTDEPQHEKKTTPFFARGKDPIKYPWTNDIDDTYKAVYGESLIDHIPELIWERADGLPSLTRYRFNDHTTNRFVEAFTDQCGKWCSDHGILLTGHMMSEPMLESQSKFIGEAMRFYRGFGIPGIDILCSRHEFNTAKQCQSAVHQYGKPGMLSELYGVTGWNFDFRGHKHDGDWQAALGVTVRVPHLSWVSMKGNAKRDYPASISYQSSWYKEYKYVEDHFARVNTALTRGKPVVKVGVIHPIESMWIHLGINEMTGTKRQKLDYNFSKLTDWLINGSIDFDFISEAILPTICEKGSSPLQVGEMAYDVVIVPECETLRSSTLERLEEFRNCGGEIIFMGDAPIYENAVPSERGKKLFERSTGISFNKSAVLDALYKYRTVEIRDGSGGLSDNLIYNMRRDSDGEWLFIAHSKNPYNMDLSTPQNIKLTVWGTKIPELWDTHTGEVEKISYSHENGKTVMNFTVYDYDSLLIYLKDTDEVGSYKKEEAVNPVPMAKLPTEVEFSLNEPNVLVLDMARYALDDEELRDTEEILRLDDILRSRIGIAPRGKLTAQPWVVEDTPPTNTVTLEFTIHSEIEYENPILALEDADIAEITFNGEKVEYKDLGFYTDVSIRKTLLPKLNVGENILRVKLPLGKRTDTEWMYLLGEFGVRVNGRKLTVTELPKTLGFSDITYQGLPFYGGSVKYKLPINCPTDREVFVKIPHYRAAVITAHVDGEKRATIAYSPYIKSLGKVKAGEHMLELEAFISRQNSFGHIHHADRKLEWVGPTTWFSKDDKWTYEYRLMEQGIITTPILYKID